MKMIYVKRSVVIEENFAMVVKDEADLSLQLQAEEEKFKASFVSKPQKDKQGNLLFHQLNNNWPPYP
jgi:hypothetical protein